MKKKTKTELVIKLNFKGPVFTSLFFIQKQSRLISYPRALQINQTMTFGRLFATSHSLLAFGKGGGAGQRCGRGGGHVRVLSQRVQRSLLQLEKFGEQLRSEDSSGEDDKHEQQQEATAERQPPH